MTLGTLFTRTSIATLAMVALAACSDSVTTPASPESSDALRPAEPHLTVGTTAVMSFWLDPRVDNIYQSFDGHRVVIPANSICQIATSGYGVGTWNNSCAPASAPILFTITTTTNSAGFSNLTVKPDVRFSPTKQVWVFFKDAVAAKTPGLVIKYCSLLNGVDTCVNEGKTDADMVTYQDPTQGFIYRRLKHFSGYNVIFGFGDDGGASGGLNLAPMPMNLYSGYITTVGLTGRSH
jgi:hypothetical protein